MELRANVLILNCCPLGPNELIFWNSLFQRYRGSYRFQFYTTCESAELQADEVIPIVYEMEVFDDDLEVVSESLKQKIQGIAEKDKVWESYDAVVSPKLAYSWLVFWTIVVRAFQPAQVIIWNGHHVPEAALAEVCRLDNLDCVFAERGPLAGTFALDRRGVNCESSFYHGYKEVPDPGPDVDVDAFKALYFANGESNWSQARRQSRQEFRQKFNIPDSKKILFFPAQVDKDTNAKLYSPHFESSGTALQALAGWCRARRESVFLLVKGHPMQELSSSMEELGLDSGVIVNETHIFDCIQNSDAILSVNSSAAFEGALFGKPVFLLGESTLNHCESVCKLTARNALFDELDRFLISTSSLQRNFDGSYFRKLLFGYLYSGKTDYNRLGMREPVLEPKFGRPCPPVTAEILGQRCSPFSPFVPSNACFKQGLLRRELEIERQAQQIRQKDRELVEYSNHFAIRLIRKFRQLMGSVET